MKGTLPTWSELAEPDRFDAVPDLPSVDPDAPDPANLWRVHWFNDAEPHSDVMPFPRTSSFPKNSPASTRRWSS